MTRLKAPKGGCVIRAYRHGLGDCFLLAFANQRPEQHYVLIDCGVLVGTADAEETMTKVAKDIAEATGGKLDVLVLTHQHWDHISGFGQAVEVFDTIEVEELWVSWAEREDDPLAQELLERYGVAMTALRAGEPLLRASGSDQAEKTREILGFLGPLDAGERWTTDTIMKGLLDRFRGATRFCTPGDEPHRISGLPEVSFFVLGPPRDVKFIRKSRPSQGDVYLTDPRTGASASLLAAVQDQTHSSNAEAWTPFSESFNSAYDTRISDSRRSHLDDALRHYRSEPWRTIDHDWLDGMSDLAIKLDSHLNNTSLALAIELGEGGRVLLFPGDAQVGNWRSWHSVSWEGRDEVTAEDLLKRTAFYKVGHHGSHNATLSDRGLELMTNTDVLRAVIPVSREMAEKRRWHMPYDKLEGALRDKTQGRVYLTDQEDRPDFVAKVTDLYADFEFAGG
jgi:hypothetical protein